MCVCVVIYNNGIQQYVIGIWIIQAWLCMFVRMTDTSNINVSTENITNQQYNIAIWYQFWLSTVVGHIYIMYIQ